MSKLDADSSRFLRSYWPVAVFVAAWLAVVAFRDPVRVMWWELRLRGADTETKQSYYVNLLSSAGTLALPAARSLLEDEDAALLGHLLRVVRDVARKLDLVDGYRVVTNCGAAAGQSVDHLHFHLLGGRKLSWPPG